MQSLNSHHHEAATLHSAAHALGVIASIMQADTAPIFRTIGGDEFCRIGLMQAVELIASRVSEIARELEETEA